MYVPICINVVVILYGRYRCKFEMGAAIEVECPHGAANID